ncbi:MAG: hydantoinase/oxoprolinase family protein [Proteobacteria bacterium]|nr:hydantoinase/oxoprolinase family protein [Pseudomonadota bacterium]
MADSSYRIGVDIGGTFTDLVLVGGKGRVRTCKVPSTPDDYGRGIVAGILDLLSAEELAPESIAGVVHASTIATNAILEGKGAVTALVTTKGFRDVLEMRRLRIPVLYDVQYEKPAPLVPRHLRFEVAERLGPKGEVRQGLDEASVIAVAGALKRAGVRALAVSLIHSYANDAHERRVIELLQKHVPGDIYFCRSSQVLPEIREYERTSTTVVNAYIGPVVERYLGLLGDRLTAIGIRAPLEIMQSNGGVMSAEAAIRRPAAIVESGPAAGVIACARMARLGGHANVISFDMGGTTAKAAMIEEGEPAKTTEYEVGAGINLSSKLVKGGGYPIKLPFIDVSEIGAGGGSIVRVDDGLSLRVGPSSAGAVPGPVCYDLGGTHPTFTDAMVVLGFLNPKAIAGGSVRLAAEKAKAAIADRVARPLGLDLAQAAFGVYTIAAATMTRAVKAVTTYRGRDPRDFVLAAFGGNGPVAAVEIARALEIGRVLIPPAPGVFTALGLLYSEAEQEFVRTLFRPAAEFDDRTLGEAFEGLKREAGAMLAAEGHAPERFEFKLSADLRYAGQAYELNVAASGPTPSIDGLVSGFHGEHERTYGHRSEGDPVDLVNLKVLARAAVRAMGRKDYAAALGAGADYRPDAATRSAYFGPHFGYRAARIVSRGALADRSLEGPVIVEEYDATAVVPPGCRAGLDDLGNIEIMVGA